MPRFGPEVAPDLPHLDLISGLLPIRAKPLQVASALSLRAVPSLPTLRQSADLTVKLRTIIFQVAAGHLSSTLPASFFASQRSLSQ